MAGRWNWAERRREEGEFRETGPEVLIIGEFLLLFYLLPLGDGSVGSIY
jgi:hypothetical protein